MTALPSLRPSISPPPVTRKVGKMARIRLGAARYSVPMRLRGTTVAVVADGPHVGHLRPRHGLLIGEVHTGWHTGLEPATTGTTTRCSTN